MAIWIAVPDEFRSNESGNCVKCHAVTHGQCGHFLDGRDTYGPFKIMNWMIIGLPHGDARERYLAWVQEHHSEIRYVQEHPNYGDVFPVAP